MSLSLFCSFLFIWRKIDSCETIVLQGFFQLQKRMSEFSCVFSCFVVIVEN